MLLLPAYATLIPLYRIMSGLGLVNTYLAVILVYTSGFLPLATWLLYNYFSSVPRSLEEAAFVDGASWLRALTRIVIPVAAPGIAAAAIITFLLGWAQFLFPLVLTSDAVYLKENLDKNVLPSIGSVYNPAGMYDAYAWVRRMQDTEGADVIYAHDPDTFRAHRHAPDCYD